ncbi:MAG TPA: sugar ABC transporter ATP-binding protein [Bryobacteraceae bacterium]|nr:sugar ABC transporter ATP-binding protein [Bryobacteraceae bacterium]
MDAVLEVADVSKSFWGIKALDRVRLSVQRGEVHAVTGENGAGKSTLMKIIAGLIPPDEGEVHFHGRGIAMIHQELLTFPDLTVAENVCMGQEPSRWLAGWLDKPAMRRQARELLARLGVAVDPSSRMGDLSIAEQQSVEIAKALAREADLIIMDEPTSALSDHEAELLFRIIGDLKQRGVTILYITHRMQEIFRLADAITVLRDGCHVATEAAGQMDEKRLIALMVGRALDTSVAKAPSRAGDVILEVRGLTRPGRFRDVSFVLRRGEILGLAGLMGAGRTDVAAAIYGLAPAASGTILVDGRAVRINSPADALSHGIAMVTEDRKQYGLVPEMSLKENVTLSSLARYGYGPFIRRRAEEAAADEQIRGFAVRTSGRDQPVKNLSGGNQQKVVIARALLADPRILILDEPTRGIDVGAKNEIYQLIARLAREGKAILLVSSEMNEILSLSDRVLVMRQGAAVAEVSPGESTPEEILAYAMPN